MEVYHKQSDLLQAIKTARNQAVLGKTAAKKLEKIVLGAPAHDPWPPVPDLRKGNLVDREAAVFGLAAAGLRGEQMIHAIKAMRGVPAVDAIPCEWLKEYAAGKRCNYASDFVLEAIEAYKRGEKK